MGQNIQNEARFIFMPVYLLPFYRRRLIKGFFWRKFFDFGAPIVVTFYTGQMIDPVTWMKRKEKRNELLPPAASAALAQWKPMNFIFDD